MQRRFLCAVLSFLGWSLGAAASERQAPDPADVTSVLEELVVEARPPRYAAPARRDRIGRVWVPVEIDGKGPFRFVVDTGATSSVIVSSVAKRLGLPVAPAATALVQGATGMPRIVPCVVADRMELGDLLVNRPKLLIVPDVFGGAEGVLGTQGLADVSIHIDFRRDVIEIEYARNKPRPAGQLMEFSVAGERLLVLDLLVGGVHTKGIIDTGAQQTIGNNRLREALLLRSRRMQRADVIGVTLDVTRGDLIRVPSIAFGSVQLRNRDITFGEMSIFEHWQLTREPALLIGMDVIGTLDTFVIDYQRRELHVRARH
jgi:predicted aspartyl protease